MKPHYWFLPALLGLVAACDTILGPADPAPTVLTIAAGDGQVDTVGTSIGTPLVVDLRDQEDRPLAGVQVEWTVTHGDATVVPVSAETTESGTASASVRLGTEPGPVHVEVGVSQRLAIRFEVIAVPDRPASIEPALEAVMIDALDDTLRLAATVWDRYGNEISDAPLTWESSDQGVVTAASDGTLRSVAPGSAVLTARSDTASATVPVTVEQAPVSIDVSPAEPRFTAVGDTLSLSALAYDRTGHLVEGASFAWSSADTAVAAVDADGTAVSRGAGVVHITARAGAAEATARVVVDPLAARVEVSPDSLTITAIEDSARFEAVAYDRNGYVVSDPDFEWASEDGDVATVADGVVTARGAGSTLIEASLDGASGSARARVAQTTTTITLSVSDTTLTAIGDTLDLEATARDRNDHEVVEATFEWSTTGNDVASVDQAGVVVSRGQGQAQITARRDGVSVSARVLVEQVPAALELVPAAVTLTALDDTLRLDATALDRNGHPIDGAEFAWTSTDTAVATVSAAGLLTARGPGEAAVEAVIGPFEARTSVLVAQRATTIALSLPDTTLTALADTVNVDAIAYDRNGYVIEGATVVWSSTAGEVASVDDEGTVISVGQGQTEIVAELDEALEGTLVTVAQTPVRVELAPDEVTMTALGDTVRLESIVHDRNGFEIVGSVWDWTTNNSAIATVDGHGVVTSTGPGEAQITVTAGEVEGTAIAHVEQAAARIGLTPNAFTFTALGATKKVTAVALDANDYEIAGATFDWSSDVPSVASVDGGGTVTSEGVGEARITATYDGLSGHATATVAQAVAAVTLSAPSDTLREQGDTLLLRATAYDARGHEIHDVAFNWHSNRVTVARVSAEGVVRAHSGRGDATITASAGGHSASQTVTRIPYGVLVLTFDDAYEDVITRVLPLLKEHGIKANIALPSGYVGETVNGHKRLTEAQIQALHNEGWAIVPHSVDHRDLTTLSTAEVDRQLRESQEWVQERGYRGSSVFIVPFHRWHEDDVDAVKKYYAAARGYGTDHPSRGEMVDWPATDPYALTSIPAVPEVYGTAAGRQQMEEQWAEAISTGKFVGTFFHQITASDFAAFEQVIERLAKYKAHLKTYADLFD